MYFKLTQHSYIEHTMEDDKNFDAAALLETNPSYQGRLKYWNNELCAQKPLTFDIVLAVSHRAVERNYC
jgi:NAD+ kinase